MSADSPLARSFRSPVSSSSEATSSTRACVSARLTPRLRSGKARFSATVIVS